MRPRRLKPRGGERALGAGARRVTWKYSALLYGTCVMLSMRCVSAATAGLVMQRPEASEASHQHWVDVRTGES